MICLALAITSSYFALISDFRKLIYTAASSLVVIFTSLWGFLIAIRWQKEAMNALNWQTEAINTTHDGKPFLSLADAGISHIGLEWGWFFLIGGSIGLLVVSKLKKVDEYFALPMYCLKPSREHILENIPAIILLASASGWIIANLIERYNSIWTSGS
jgi:hypothetical protein